VLGRFYLAVNYLCDLLLDKTDQSGGIVPSSTGD